jgi:hypothetical protein
VAVWPAETAADVDESVVASEKSIAWPDRAMVRGLPSALSVIEIDATLLPTLEGANTTEILHEAPAARVAPQS